jgi:hypothetical protein
MRRLVENIGNVAPKSQTTRSVAIQNDSSFPWTVSKVVTDCGCLVHHIEPPMIGAGLASTLTFCFTASTNPGTIHRRILISFREPNTPSVSIDVTGFVRTWCYAQPESVNLGVVVVGGDEKPPVRNVLLRLAPGSSLSKRRPPETPDWLTATSSTNSPDGKADDQDGEAVTVRLVPSFSKNAAPGPFAAVVTFRSSAEPPEQLQLPVRGSLRFYSSLEAMPDRLFLGTHRAGEQFATKITIQGKSLPPRLGATYLKQRIHVSHDLGANVVIKSTPREEPARFDLECHFRMPTEQCFLTGTITVQFEDHEPLGVPVAVKVGRSN